jgi:flavin-dependent dehydrogenase
MSLMFDVIIVGARCAGSPLAMLLARRGYRVLVVDKTRFPSDTVSTHFIWHAGLARAKRWGLLEGICSLGAPPVRRVRLDNGAFEISGTPPPADGVDFAVGPRRTSLDHFLVNAARAAGADVREQFLVTGLLIESGRVVGIRGSTEERGRVIVGADGVHSVVAHCVDAPRYNQRPSTAGAWYAYWEDGPVVSDFENYFRADIGGAAFPTSDGLTCVVAGWRHSAPIPKAPPEQGYRLFLESSPRMTEFLHNGRQVTPIRGTPEQPGFFRRPWGDGWALAGDAGYHKHPLSAQGITDAFRDADLLSEAIDDGFSGQRPLEVALAEYERRRNEAVMGIYESTCDRARIEPPPPEVRALFNALRYNQSEADRFFGIDSGTVPIREFFSPENVARILSSTRPEAMPG